MNFCVDPEHLRCTRDDSDGRDPLTSLPSSMRAMILLLLDPPAMFSLHLFFFFDFILFWMNLTRYALNSSSFDRIRLLCFFITQILKCMGSFIEDKKMK